MASYQEGQGLTTAVGEEAYAPQHRLQAAGGLGHVTLEGFTILDTAPSPWQDVRNNLEDRIIGQPAAIDAIIDVLEGATVRAPSDKRPMATLAFLGPTGVGKSETAKSLAEFMEGSNKIIKIDCSNFSHGHEVAGLIGSPVGYVGYGREPILSPDAVDGYGTVILFDEIEKGSDELYNIMLQIMEDGELRLNNGETTSFRDALIVLTSNLGAKEMAAQLSDNPLGFGSRGRQVSTQQLDEVATKSFQDFFRPEFVNRISRMVVFHPLDNDGLGEVLDTKLRHTNKEYETEFGARISISEGVRDYLVAIAALQPHMGARPLIRALDDHIYSPFGRYWGAGAVEEYTHVKVFHREELGQDAPAGDDPLIFTAKRDRSIRRRVVTGKALMLPSANTVATTQEAEATPPSDEPTPED